MIPDALGLVVNLLEDSQGKDTFGDIDLMLERVLGFTTFDGVILWLPWQEEIPNVTGRTWRMNIYPAASFFREKPSQHVFHSLTHESPTAQHIECREAQYYPVDPLNDNGHDSERKLMEHFGIDSVAIIPFDLGGETSWRHAVVGSLNFYRCGGPGRDFKAEDPDFETAKAYTRLFAFCFASAVDAVGFRLLDKVKHILANEDADLSPDESAHGATVKRVCATLEWTIARMVPCREVCLHLLSDEAQNETVSCMAGIWPWKSRRQVLHFAKGYGITGACFREGKTIIIGDAIKLTDEGIYECAPPFLRADAELADIEKDVSGDFAPVSVIAIPLIDRQRTIGVLRCAAKSRSPYFFGVHEVFFLEQVCALIADWFGRQFVNRNREKKLNGTRAIVEAVTKFSARIEKLASSGQEIPTLDLRDLADSWIAALPPQTTVCFRIRAHNDPVFLRNFSKPRADQGKRARSHLPEFSWSDYENCIQQYFASGGADCRWPDPPWAPDSGINSFMVLPLSSKPGEVQGCVEVSSSAPGVFSEEDRHLCYLFSKLSSFAGVLQHHVKAKSEAVRNLSEASEAQEKSFKLLAHQVKTPLSTALVSIERLFERAQWKMIVPEKLRESAVDTRRAVMRAWRVAQRMRIFSDIAIDGNVPRVDLQPISDDELRSRLEEMAEDHQYQSATRRKLKIAVSQIKDKEEYAILPLTGDIDLLEQAAEILLENAVKYGDERSRIDIVISNGNRGRHQMISVRNFGKNTPLRPNEVKRAMEFGTRLDRALSTRRTGWGAGLYLARQIMRAHRGDLLVAPTSDRDITTFTLSFPRGQQA